MTFVGYLLPGEQMGKEEKAEPVVSKSVQTHFLANNCAIHFENVQPCLFSKVQTNLLKHIVQQIIDDTFFLIICLID